MNRLVSKVNWATLAFVLILLVGSVLRFHELGEESLWNDELESWRQSSFEPLSAVISEGVIPDTHPPAFQVVLYFVVNNLGSGEAQLRLPSAISGFLTIFVVFLIGRRFYGEREGLIAALFMAVLWAPIRYSQEARNYALVVLLAAMAGLLWMEIVRRIQSGRDVNLALLGGYVLSGIAAAYTHYFGLVMVALQAVFLLVLVAVTGQSARAILLSYLAMAALYAPWIPAMLEQSTHTIRIGWIGAPGLRAFPAFISFAYNRLRWLGVVVIVGYGWLLWQGADRLRGDNGRRLLAQVTSADGMLFYWLGAPMVVAYMVSLLWTPVFTQRNLLICLPPAYLLCARAIGTLPIRRLGQAGIALAIAGVALHNLVYSTGYYRFDQKEQYREAARYVVDRYAASRDPSVIGYSRFPDYFDYYFERMGSEVRIDLTAGENEDRDRLRAYLEDVNPDRIWFLSAHRPPDDGFLEALLADYQVIDHKAFIMAEVRLLVRAGG